MNKLGKKVGSYFVRGETLIERILSAIGAGMIMVIAFITLADVVVRDITHRSLSGAYELIQVLLAVTIFFGIAYTMQLKGHLRVTFLVSRLERTRRHVVEIIDYVLILFICAVACYGTSSDAILSVQIKEVTTGSIGWPLSVARIAIALGYFLLFCRVIIQLSEYIKSMGIPETSTSDVEPF